MGFIKVIKNKAYFKRYQTKFRRRREAKTDYYARKKLIIQDKNKYKTPKYRFVVRFTNKDVVCQIFSSDMDHDVCIAAAYSHELRRYGITLGLTNFAAAYCTGLLLARRVNAKYKLDYKGVDEVDGEEYHIEPSEEEGAPAPFMALLDVGLKRTSTGSRVFGALLGACHGGLDIPHNTRRFPGSNRTEEGEWEHDAEMVKKYIFGGHVAEYMTSLAADDEEAYNKLFGAYVKAKVSADSLEGIYTKAHAAIRADPLKARADSELGNNVTRKGKKTEPVQKRWRPTKRSKQQRMDRVRQKLTAKGIKSCAGNK